MTTTKKTTPIKKGGKGRKPNGQFKKGEYPGGPGRGNGKDKVCREALEIIRNEIDEEKLRAAVNKLYDMATKGRGNVKAIALLLAYKAGKPPETVNIGTNGDGIKLVVDITKPNGD